jgi:hypothetical protein
MDVLEIQHREIKVYFDAIYKEADGKACPPTRHTSSKSENETKRERYNIMQTPKRIKIESQKNGCVVATTHWEGHDRSLHEKQRKPKKKKKSMKSDQAALNHRRS